MELLDERKYASTSRQLSKLAKKYDIDAEKLDNLARYVNRVSVDQTTVKRWVGEDGTENVTMTVSLHLSV